MTVLPDQSIPKYTAHVGRIVIVFKKKKNIEKSRLVFHYQYDHNSAG